MFVGLNIIDGFDRLTGQRDELEPWGIEPEQFYEREQPDLPSRRLFVAMLECAIADAEHGCRTVPMHAVQGRERRGTYYGLSSLDSDKRRREQERRKNHARQWILSEEAGDWPGTFVNVCEALGLDASAVRRAIRARWA